MDEQIYSGLEDYLSGSASPEFLRALDKDARAQREHPLGAEFTREHPPKMIVAGIVHPHERTFLLVDDNAGFGDGRKIRVGELAAETGVD